MIAIAEPIVRLGTTTPLGRRTRRAITSSRALTSALLRFCVLILSSLLSYPFDWFNYAGIDRSVWLYSTPKTFVAGKRRKERREREPERDTVCDGENRDIWRREREREDDLSRDCSFSFSPCAHVSSLPLSHADITVRTNCSTEGAAATVSLALAAAGQGPNDSSLSFSVLLLDAGGVMVSQFVGPISADEILLRVANASLWWPNGYGAPYLYTLQISILNDSSLVDVYRLKVRKSKEERRAGERERERERRERWS